MDRADEQRLWGDVNKREHKINKTALKRNLLKHAHVKARKGLQSKIMDNTVGHKQSRRFLECIDDKFLLMQPG